MKTSLATAQASERRAQILDGKLWKKLDFLVTSFFQGPISALCPTLDSVNLTIAQFFSFNLL